MPVGNPNSVYQTGVALGVGNEADLVLHCFEPAMRDQKPPSALRFSVEFNTAQLVSVERHPYFMLASRHSLKTEFNHGQFRAGFIQVGKIDGLVDRLLANHRAKEVL